MTDLIIKQDAIVFDTCCLITVFATGHGLEVLAALPKPALVADDVTDVDVIYVRTAAGQLPLDLEPALQQGVLQRIVMPDVDRGDYLDLRALNLDRGEAATSVLALKNNWAVATDERKCTYYLNQTAPHIQVVTTPEIIKCWADIRNLSEDEIRAAIAHIHRYRPPRDHPLLSWWDAYIT